MSDKINIIQSSPRGWWYNDGRVADQWHGPFATPEEAEEMAIALAPDKQEFITLINLQLWEHREVKIEKNRPCPDCDRGYTKGWEGDMPQGSPCRRCGGSGRLEA